VPLILTSRFLPSVYTGNLDSDVRGAHLKRQNVSNVLLLPTPILGGASRGGGRSRLGINMAASLDCDSPFDLEAAVRCLLVRVGTDRSVSGGSWNAPVDWTSGEFA
jgi:hypothetical protein